MKIINCQKCGIPLFAYDKSKTGKLHFGNIRCKSCLKSFQPTIYGMLERKTAGKCFNCGKQILVYSDLDVPESWDPNPDNEIVLFCSKRCYKLYKLKE